MGIDASGHLAVLLCTAAQNTQREGRAGRLYNSLFKPSRPCGFREPPSNAYELPKHDALALLLTAVDMQKAFPTICIPESKRQGHYNNLEALPLLQKNSSGQYALTYFGHEVRQQGLSFRSGILTACCSLFDLAWFGRIAAAYISAQVEVYLQASYSATCGLNPKQIAVAHNTGFLSNGMSSAGPEHVIDAASRLAPGAFSAAHNRGPSSRDVVPAESNVAPGALDEVHGNTTSSLTFRSENSADAGPNEQKSDTHTVTHTIAHTLATYAF